MFGREMFFTAQKETSSQPYLADCAGHQYRLQFNAYRYMIEKKCFLHFYGRQEESFPADAHVRVSPPL